MEVQVLADGQLLVRALFLEEDPDGPTDERRLAQANAQPQRERNGEAAGGAAFGAPLRLPSGSTGGPFVGLRGEGRLAPTAIHRGPWRRRVR